MNKSKIVAFVAAFAVLASTTVANAAFMFEKNLSYGMRNADVAQLQTRLNAEVGTSLPGTTYFGAATRAAVKQYQTANNISPVSGYVGPLTRAVLNGSTTNTNTDTGTSTNTGTGSTTLPAGCSSTTGFSSTTGAPCNGTGSTGNQTGPVSVSLATTNPASGVVVAGQATANLAQFTFTGTGTVNSVTLKRVGISDQNTLTNVYLYDGVSRLTDGYSFNNNGDLMINNLGLMVSGSKTISVMADVYASAPSGQTIAVSMTSFTAGTTANTVSLSGNMMSIASGSTLASIGKSGSNTTSTATVNAGVTSYQVWGQSFQVNTRTLWMKAANFRVTGSAPADALANVGLYIDGVKAGNNAAMVMTNGSNYLSFDMSAAPVSLTTGSHSFEVRADIVKGSSYNFTVSLQQASDIMVMDPQVGVNIAVCGNTSCTTTYSASTAGTITIGTGSATVSIDPVFSAISNTVGGASNSVIGKFKVRGYGEDIKVSTLYVRPAFTTVTAPAQAGTCTSGSSTTADGLQNVTLYFNGTQIGSQQNWCSGLLTFNLGSQMIIPANMDSTLEVRADLRNLAGSNYTSGTVAVTVDSDATANSNTGYNNAEGYSSKSGTIDVPTADVTTSGLAIQSSTLAVSKNTGYGSQTLSPNTAGVKIGSFVLQNQSTSEGVRVTSLSVAVTYGAGVASTNFSGLRTSEISGNGSTPVQPATAAASSTGTNTFSVDFTIPAGGTKTIDVFADSSTTTGVTATTSTILTASGLGTVSNVSTSATASTGQLITFNSGTVATPTLVTASATSAQFVAAGDPSNTGTGAADATKATYSFVSTGGASTISELKFTVTGTATDAVMSVKVGSVSAPVVGGIAWLQGLNLSVPNGGSGLTVDALVSYAPVGTSGVSPNTTSIVSLTYVKYTSGGTTATLSPSVAAPTMTLVGSKPTVTIASALATGLVVSASVETKIAEVTIAADAKGAVKVNDIVFSTSGSGYSTNPTAIASPRIADGSTTISGTTCTPASLVVTCEFGTSSNTDFDGYQIAAGTSKTFTLYGITTGAANTGSGTPTLSTSLTQASFNWDDSSTNGVSGTNLSGTGIYTFPTNSFSIKQ